MTNEELDPAAADFADLLADLEVQQMYGCLLADWEQDSYPDLTSVPTATNHNPCR